MSKQFDVPEPLKTLLNDVLLEAKSALKIHDKLQPIAIPLTINEILEPLFLEFKKEENDLDMFFNIGAFCRMHDAVGVVIVFNGAGKKFKTKKEHDYFMQNVDTENPLLYPENMRENYILVQYIDFQNSFANVVKFCQYFREKGILRFGRSVIKQSEKNPITEAVEFAWGKFDRRLSDAMKSVENIKGSFNLEKCEECPEYEICKKACIDSLVNEISVGTNK
jgi:hypothetical protein